MRGIVRGVLAALVALAVSGVAWGAELPPPRMEGGMGLFEAFKKRASVPGGDFPTGKLELEELSTILWAASGLNRGERGWTVPMARGLAPYCKVYVAEDVGIFLYDWRTHSLKEISKENVRAKVGAQSFVKMAPCILIVVADGEGLAEFDEPDRAEFANVAAGAMTQDIYLAAAALGVGTRYIHSMRVDEIQRALGLPEGDRPICLMMLGK
ncbi:MAG: nitroreductase family protein [Synergistaceae bacterium]|nr:nitroreductase family protein [Synergistaceae bacterium]